MMRYACAAVMAGCGFDISAMTPSPGTIDAPTLDGPRIDGPPGDGPAAIDAPSGTINFAGFATGGGQGTTLSTQVQGVAGTAFFVGIASKPYRDVATLDGLGTTWTELGDQCGARSQTGVSVWFGIGPTLPGTLTATFASGPIENAVMVVAGYTNYVESGPLAFYNALDATSCIASSSTVDVASYTVGVDSLGGTTIAFVATRQYTHTPGTGLVQRVQHVVGSGGSTAGIALVDGIDAAAISGMFSSETDVAAIAFELR